MFELLPFQKRFIKGAFAPGINTAALSLSRGNGKSSLVGHLISLQLNPNHKWFRNGTESVLCAASLEQARICFRVARTILEPTGEYSFTDNITRIGIRHKATNTRLRVLSSNANASFGIVNCPVAYCDEPGAWSARGGQLMFDSLMTAQGKPQSPLRVLFIGTLAPAESGWWHDLVEAGSSADTYVQALRGDPKKWDQYPEIRRCNPLMSKFPESRTQLLKERDKARKDSRLKARFLSYRLNCPTRDEVEVLVTVDEYKRVLKREVPPRIGRPIVSVDMGGGRAWTAATALWQNGRLECLALCSGDVTIAEMEKRDRVAPGTYAGIENLYQCPDGQSVPLASDLASVMRSKWGDFLHVVCDYFRQRELKDALGPYVLVEPRRARWSEASEDIRGFRRMALDGPVSIEDGSRSLLTASLAASRVEADTSGNLRLVKRVNRQESRDDCVASAVLATGAWCREVDRLKARR